MSGFGTGNGFSYFVDSEIGLTMRGIVIEEIHNAHGQHYWKAASQIGSIFGSPVEGELIGIGATKEKALEKLAQETQRT